MITTTASAIDQLADKVRELAIARPETVYRPAPTGQTSPAAHCSYLGGTCSDGTLGCLVGQALLAVGFTVEQLRSVDLFGIEEALDKLHPFELTDHQYQQVRWLESVQNAQDNGYAWREAIAIANQEEPP
jgi:hypothetical protein